MKKTIIYISFFLVAGLISVGCSQYSKLLKSDDSELLYKSAFEYYEAGKYQKAITLFQGEKVRLRYMNTPRADTIMFYTGMSYYKMGDFDLSSTTFDEFRRTYSSSPFLEEAEFMYAMGFYYMSPPPYRDQGATSQALVTIDEYMERYPNSPKQEELMGRMVELMGKLHDKEYINAHTYYKIGNHKSAVIALKNALNKFPDTRHREELLYLIAKSGYELADNSVTSLKRDRFLDMRDYYLNYIAEFPEGKHRKELDKMDAKAREYIASFGDPDITVNTTN